MYTQTFLQKKFKMSKRVTCDSCGGCGEIGYDEDKETCQFCHGTGYVYEPDDEDIAREKEEERKYGKRLTWR